MTVAQVKEPNQLTEPCADCGRPYDPKDLNPMRDGSVICDDCRWIAEQEGGK